MPKISFNRPLKKTIPFLLFLIFSITLNNACICKRKSKLIKQCPEEWIINKMPTVNSKNNLPNEYFIIDGERKEIENYDLKWIRNNCKTLEPTIVY